MEKAELLIYKENLIDNDFMSDWLNKFPDDEIITSLTKKLEDIEK